MGCASSVDAANSEGISVDDLLEESKLGEFDLKYSLGRVIGKGGFAKVRAIRRREDREHLAVKIVTPRPDRNNAHGDEKRRDAQEAQFKRDVASELTTWASVRRNEHVVKFITATVEQHMVFMVMERCQGSLVQKMTVHPEVWKTDSLRMLKEMVLGVQACHEANIVHRDIKPENFLVGLDGKSVKLCDFGLAARMPSHGQLKGTYGTVPFMSPEMLKGLGYGKATDVWSLGATVYFLVYGECPFIPDRPTREDMKKAILAGTVPRRLHGASSSKDSAASFVEMLMTRCAGSRCTTQAALQHRHLNFSPPRCAPTKPSLKHGMPAIEFARTASTTASASVDFVSEGEDVCATVASTSECESTECCSAGAGGEAVWLSGCSTTGGSPKASAPGSKTSSKTSSMPGSPTRRKSAASPDRRRSTTSSRAATPS